MKWASSKQTGFTIVELLIVVVVIAILAAITIVSYNGITANAKHSSMKSDIAAINKAINLYYADNGVYPPNASSGCTNGWCGWDQVTGDNFIPGLVPKYISSLPQLPTENANDDTYLYTSNGTSYRIMRYKGTGLPNNERNSPMAGSPQFTNTGWGYKSSNIDWGGAAI